MRYSSSVTSGLLLERLGAKRCGTAHSPDGRVGERWGLSRGRLVIVSPDAGRPRVPGVQRVSQKSGIVLLKYDVVPEDPAGVPAEENRQAITRASAEGERTDLRRL